MALSDGGFLGLNKFNSLKIIKNHRKAAYCLRILACIGLNNITNTGRKYGVNLCILLYILLIIH